MLGQNRSEPLKWLIPAEDDRAISEDEYVKAAHTTPEESRYSGRANCNIKVN